MAYTLANLQTDIRSYTEVAANVLTDAILNNIIKNAENDIYRAADSDEERFYATSNLTANNRYVSIPSDLRFIRYVQVTDGSGNQVYLEPRDTSFMVEYYSTPNTSSTDLPKYYGNWDASTWVIAPTPNANYGVTLAYNKEPTSLTSTVNNTSTTGTYVSNKYQDVLLYKCLVNTYAYLKGPTDMLQYYNQAYEKALMTYAVEQQGRRRRDEDSDGEIRTQLVSESPSAYGNRRRTS